MHTTTQFKIENSGDKIFELSIHVNFIVRDQSFTWNTTTNASRAARTCQYIRGRLYGRSCHGEFLYSGYLQNTYQNTAAAQLYKNE